MQMRRKSLMYCSVFFLMFSFVFPMRPVAGAPTKVWEEAAEVYSASMKLYNLNQWQDAQTALQGFVDDFSSNENVPLAYLQIAYCYEALGKNEEKLKTLEKVTKAFPDSQAAFYAWSVIYYDKLAKAQAAVNAAASGGGDEKEVAKTLKPFKDFVLFLENMEKEFGGLFTGPYGAINWPRVGDYYWYYSTGRTLWWIHYRVIGFNLNLYPLNGWNYNTPDQGMAASLLALATDQTKADDLLKALQPCFRKLDDDLPASWKLMHVKLLQKSKGGEKAAKTQLDKYEAFYKKGDPVGIELKTLQLKEAWDEGKMDKVKELSNYFVDNFMGFEDVYHPLTRWMDNLYASGDNTEFIRISKLYMDKTPEGAWREAILDRWVSLAERDAAKPADVIALIDADQANYSANMVRVKANLMRKVQVYTAAKNPTAAAQAMTQLLGRECWSKESFDWADRIAAADPQFKALVEGVCEQYGIVREKQDNPSRAIYDDLLYRISQDKDRFIEELANKLYTEYRRDYYAIMGVQATVKYFYEKAAHQQRDKWADIMLSAYPFNPLSQDVVQWQINAADATKNFEMLARWTDLGMKNFPGADATDKWIDLRLSCFDAAKDIQSRAACARNILRARADSGEPAAIRMLGRYECETMNTPKQQCTYWLSLAGKYKGKFAEVVCNQQAWEYGYNIPCNKWLWGTVDFEGAARGIAALAEQDFRPDWKWKTVFDDANVLSMGAKGTMAMQALVKKLPQLKFSAQLQRRLDMPNLGYACGAEKLQSKALGILSRVKGMADTGEGKMCGTIMLANMYRFAGQSQQAAKAYIAAAGYYKRPVMRWQLMMMAYQCMTVPEQIGFFSSYASQMKNAQDRRPWLLGCVAQGYIHEKNFAKAKGIMSTMMSEYKASSDTGALVESLKKLAAPAAPAAGKQDKPAKKKSGISRG